MTTQTRIEAARFAQADEQPEASADSGSKRMLIALVAAFVAGALALYLATADPVLVGTYVIGTLVVLLGVRALARSETPRVEIEPTLHDWSVTLAAIARRGIAIAITDRANRLVCANNAYVDVFGAAASPPGLDLTREGVDALTRLAREAWRDGSASLPDFVDERVGRWAIVVERAGRGDDHLVWNFDRRVKRERDVASDLDLGGELGAMLSRAGIETAITGPDGTIRSASTGFASRAADEHPAKLVGQDFVSYLRADERDRILFAREGRAGMPQTLIDVPLVAGPDDTANEVDLSAPGPDEAPSLMLLIDSTVGIGGNWDGSTQAGVAQLEALLAQLPLGLAMTDRDGRFLFGNKAFLRSAGRDNAPPPSFPTDLVVHEDKAALSDAVRRHGRGPATSGDVAVRLATRPDEPVSLGLAGVRGLGEPAVMLMLADSSEENKLKRQIAQATKMQAVGQLAGGVAHDFNNVLTAIIGTCDLMLLRHTPGASDYDDIQQILANSNRAAALTRQLLAFSRQQTLRPEILQLPDVVSEVSPLIRQLLGERIDFEVTHDRNLNAVRADPQQLEQVIMNLAVNARDAINSNAKDTDQTASGARGRIELRTSAMSALEAKKLDNEIMPPADYTVLMVEDTGGGIPKSLLPKLFEPFFTTKEQGKGTGLGLSTAYGIVKQSGGFIFADNIVDRQGRTTGARFTVYFPAHQGKAPRATERTDPEASDWSQGGSILLVEDEDMVRAVAERALSRAGYEVTACRDGEDGLAAIGQGTAFDLVVSDVVMPGLDGPAMVRAIREQRPQIPVLFMSGYAEESLRKDIDIPNVHFIAKPFSVAGIGDKVGAVMRAAKSEPSV